MAVLAATLVLLVSMTAIAVFVHRALLISQRSASNEKQARQAALAAEAGIAWALAKANDPRSIDAACTPVTGSAESFTARYLAPSAPMAALPEPPITYVGCSLEDDTLRCTCLTPASTPASAPPEASTTAAPAETPCFTLVFQAKSPLLVHVASQGCAPGAPSCRPGTAHALGVPGQSVVEAILQRGKNDPPSSTSATGPDATPSPEGSASTTTAPPFAASPASAPSPGPDSPPRWTIVPGSWHDS